MYLPNSGCIYFIYVPSFISMVNLFIASTQLCLKNDNDFFFKYVTCYWLVDFTQIWAGFSPKIMPKFLMVLGNRRKTKILCVILSEIFETS